MLRTDVCPTRTAQYCRLFQIGYVSAAMGLSQLAPYLGYGAVGGLSIIKYLPQLDAGETLRRSTSP
jgi:hypothetical protein